MADSQNNITQEIPQGFCQCGCGQKTKIALWNNTAKKWKAGKPLRFINGHNNGWKHGRIKIPTGYIKISMPEHPRADRDDYVLEHILLAEKALGKPLPSKAEVHHANGLRDGGELVVCENHAYHALLHRRMKALKTCGYANWRKCKYCQQYDDPLNMYVRGVVSLHRNCANKYMQNRKRLKLLNHRDLPNPIPKSF